MAMSLGANTVIVVGSLLNPNNCKSRNEAMDEYPLDLKSLLASLNQEAPGNPMAAAFDGNDLHLGPNLGLLPGPGA
ncbi:hypothetical protein G4B88_005871 [Cannabis sativa]|uniref:Uncharacterized protein n=1 Tax=Cannabis sativa TaxID=3483 RepID=A0A7J6IBD0_CANSA|nr:hypothetical protein G4B88_005871 [Cannabis sativa]